MVEEAAGSGAFGRSLVAPPTTAGEGVGPGGARTAPRPHPAETHAHIRSRLRQWFGAHAAEQCHVIYGGSVKPDNIHELVLLPDVDGALVGGASLDVRAFGDIVARSRQSAV